MTMEYIAKHELVAQLVPNAITNVIDVVPVLVAGAAWRPFGFVNDSLEYVEVAKQTDAGTYYEATLSGLILKDTIDSHTITNILPHYELIVRITHRNGEVKLIGNKDKGLRYNDNLSSGADARAASKIAFAMTLQMEQRAPYYII